MYDFVLSRIHSRPGLHAAHGLQVGHLIYKRGQWWEKTLEMEPHLQFKDFGFYPIGSTDPLEAL